MITIKQRKVEWNYKKGKKIIDTIDYFINNKYKASAFIEPENRLRFGDCGAVIFRIMGKREEVFCVGASKENALDLKWVKKIINKPETI